MEILREGSKEKIREYRVKHKEIYILTCEVCDCQFEVAQGDREIQSDQREGSMWVKCPFCKRNVDII